MGGNVMLSLRLRAALLLRLRTAGNESWLPLLSVSDGLGGRLRRRIGAVPEPGGYVSAAGGGG